MRSSLDNLSVCISSEHWFRTKWVLGFETVPYKWLNHFVYNRSKIWTALNVKLVLTCSERSTSAQTKIALTEVVMSRLHHLHSPVPVFMAESKLTSFTFRVEPRYSTYGGKDLATSFAPSLIISSSRGPKLLVLKRKIDVNNLYFHSLTNTLFSIQTTIIRPW